MGIKQSRSRQLATRLMYATLVLLDKNGGEMRLSEIVERLDKEMNFGEWEQYALGNDAPILFDRFGQSRFYCQKPRTLVSDR